MQTLKRGLMATFLLFSPLVQADGLQDQLNTFFAQKLAGFSDEVVVTVRTHQICIPPVSSRSLP